MTPAWFLLRCPNGCSAIRKRPSFRVVFVPSTPMKLVRLATSGSRSRRSAKACWVFAMPAYEAVCADSVTPWISPVSWVGNSPLGISRNRTTVSTSVPTATIRVAASRASTQVSATS